MRVLHLTSSFPRWSGDHSAPYLLTLARLQAEAGLEVEVLAPHDAGAATLEVLDGVTVRRFRYAPGRWERLAYRGGLPAGARTPVGAVLIPVFLAVFVVRAVVLARRLRPDVLHAHWWFPSGAVAWLASRLTGAPMVVTLHGSDVELLRRRWIRPLARRVLSAGVTGSVSRQLGDAARAVAGLEDLAVEQLPMPVTAAPLEGVSPPPAPPIRLVAAGRFTTEKGFETLVDAVNSLVSEGVDVQLDLVGDGPLAAALRERARPSGNRIRFVPACAPAELWERVGRAHALVVPSLREGLGLVAVEALALARPVIASRVGGLPEAVEDGIDGILVSPGDAEALAAAISRLPLDPPAAGSARGHAPSAVVDAHISAYEAAGEVDAVRWRVERWVGGLVAALLLAWLVRIVARDWPTVRDTWSAASPVLLGLAVAATIAAEVGFALASARALRLVAGPVASPVAAAAGFLVSQNAKHLPGGIWPVVARAGLARRWKVSSRTALLWVGVESLASVGGGAVVGGLTLALTGPGPVALWIAVASAGLLVPLAVHPASPGTRLLRRVLGTLPEPTQVARLVVPYLPVWAAASAAVALLGSAVVSIPIETAMAIGGAAVLASVAGFLAIPVPAGLGVREAAFSAMSAPFLSASVAVSVALGARVVATVVQLALGAVGLPLLRRTAKGAPGAP